MYATWRDEDKILYQNETAFSILSVTPAVPGQAVVIPRSHITSLRQLDNEGIALLYLALDETFSRIQRIYARNPAHIISFYDAVRENPPFPSAGEDAAAMLLHPDLQVPPTGYNTGSNHGEAAGQLLEHHHIHLFPRRGNGKGVVTAMKQLEKII
jgi:diadenosine tetraphosphate (Ap4A) HIT family hydrolase